MYHIYHFGEMWSNSRIAEEVKRLMGSNTGAGNISWYKVNLKKGKLKMESYVDTTVEPKSVKLKGEVKKIPASQLAVAPGAVTAVNSEVQKLAMAFFRSRTTKDFEALYHRIAPGLEYYSTQILKDKSLAQDVVNSSFTKIWLKIDQYNPHFCFSTWAYKIVRNESMQLVRRQKQFSSLDVKSTDDDGSGRFSEYNIHKHVMDQDDITYTPNYFEDDEQDIKDETYKKVVKQIKSLPATYKEIMMDRELNGMKYKEIAEKHGININSVKTRIKRARMQIISSNEDYFKKVKKPKREKS